MKRQRRRPQPSGAGGVRWASAGDQHNAKSSDAAAAFLNGLEESPRAFLCHLTYEVIRRESESSLARLETAPDFLCGVILDEVCRHLRRRPWPKGDPRPGLVLAHVDQKPYGALAFIRRSLRRSQETTAQKQERRAREAAQRPPTERQVHYLRKLGFRGEIPDFATAHRLIDELVARRRPAPDPRRVRPRRPR